MLPLAKSNSTWLNEKGTKREVRQLISKRNVVKTECNTSVQTVFPSKDKHSNTLSKVFIWYDTLSKWRNLMTDSSELLEFQISSR